MCGVVGVVGAGAAVEGAVGALFRELVAVSGLLGLVLGCGGGAFRVGAISCGRAAVDRVGVTDRGRRGVVDLRGGL